MNNLNKIALGFFITLIISFVLIIIFDNKGKEIKQEKERLIQVEEKIVKSIQNNDTSKAITYLPQLRWQVVGSNIGEIKETEKLTKIWDSKREEYYEILNIK